MKKKLLILILIGFTKSYTQNTISGIVTDLNNKALIGVEIYSTSIHKGTTSDENGSYVIINIPNEKITIQFSSLGYKTILKELVLNNQDIILNIQLEESVFKMDDIIVSTPFRKIQSENIMKVERLSAKKLQQTGAATLSEGITSIPGVSQASTGTSTGKPVIRGLSGNRVVTYTQGLRLENQQFGADHGLGISDSGIESIEVIKGPASLLYGSDALGGVIYIEPEKFAKKNETKFNLNQRLFSNSLGSSTSIGIKTSLEKWQFLARGGYKLHADYKTPQDERVTNTRFNEKDFNLGIGLHINKITSNLRYNYNNSNIGLTEGIEEQTTSTKPKEPFQSIKNHLITIRNHVHFDNSTLDFDLGFINNQRQEFEDHHEELGDIHEEEGAALDNILNTFSINSKYHIKKFKKLDLLFGLQGMFQTNKNYGEELLIPDAQVSDFGFFTTTNYKFDSKNSLQAGIRFDNRIINTKTHVIEHEFDQHILNGIDKSFNSLTASLGYKTKVLNSIVTRINLANGFRSPNLAELTSNGIHHGTNRFEKGNNKLINEKNFQIDVALEYEANHFEVVANVFYNTISDYIFLSPTGMIEDGAPLYTYLQDDASLYGGEFGVHLHPHPFDWLHLESTFETVIGKQENNNYLPAIPANILKNSIRGEFNINDKLKNSYAFISFHNSFKQNKVSPLESKTANYNLFNLGFGTDLIINKYKFTTSVITTNLLNTKYIDHLSRLKNDNILNSGRNIVFSLQFNL